MSSSNGLSNYIDSGWVIPTDQQVYQTPQNEAPVDIYVNVPQVGVFMYNGKSWTDYATYPIYGTCSNFSSYSIAANDSDDAYLLYPGFGIQLFTGANYTDTSSNICNNNTTSCVIFYVGNASWFGGEQIYELGTTTVYPINKTSSIYVYFRGQQILGPWS